MKAIHFLGAMVISFGTVIAQANVVGVNVQNFNPITSGLDFVTVHSSETLRPCNFNCGLFMNYVKNSLPNFNTGGSSSTDFEDYVISADLNFGVGLTKNWDMGLSVAGVADSDAEDNGPSTIKYDNKGLNDIRFNTKYRFTGDRDGGIAAVFSMNFVQVENSPYAGEDVPVWYNLEFVGDTTLSNRVALAANVGYRFRDKGDGVFTSNLRSTPPVTGPIGQRIEPIGDQWIASLAASYYFESSSTKLIGEVYAGIPADSDANSSFTEDLETVEMLVGLKHDFSQSVAGHFGATIGLGDGTASPDWRVYAGLNWAFGPLSACRKKPEVIRVQKDETPAEAIEKAEEDASLSLVDIPIAEENPYTTEPRQRIERFVISNVLFDTNKDVLKPEGEEAVAQLAEYLNRSEGFESLVIEGHTDSMSSEAYNLDLSRRRSLRVRKELIRLGVSDQNMKAMGYGESRPIADNGNPQGRALNRRVEFQVDWGAQGQVK